MTQQQLSELQIQSIPKFNQPELLLTALTHSSALAEGVSPVNDNYERLEYLGDAVIQFLVSDHLIRQYPDLRESLLTKYRSALVKGPTLAEMTLKLGLEKYIYFGRGQEKSKGSKTPSILADVFESVMGALYLDQGLTAVSQMLETHLYPLLPEIIKNGTYDNARSKIQQIVQKHGLPLPQYLIVSESGPIHNMYYQAALLVNGVQIATGGGKSKQRAQVEAATRALADLEVLDTELKKIVAEQSRSPQS